MEESTIDCNGQQDSHDVPNGNPPVESTTPKEDADNNRTFTEISLHDNDVNNDASATSSLLTTCDNERDTVDNKCQIKHPSDNIASEIPVLTISSADHVQKGARVSKGMIKMESEDEDDALLSELESELQIDSDASSQATDVPPSDEDAMSRNSYCPYDSSSNISSHANSDINLHARKLSISQSSSSSSPTPADSYRNTEYHEIQIEALERTIIHLRQNVNHYKQRLRAENDSSKKTLEKTKTDYSAKIEKLNKMYDGAKKEKETMVMKFANGEREKLKFARSKEDLERKTKEACRDREMLLGKMKQLTTERNQLNVNFEAKMNECRSTLKENERLKEEISSKDVKIKWGQNKLKAEVDAHKETQGNLEKVHMKLLATREEADQVRRDCQQMIRQYQESEEIKSASLDKELRVRTTQLEKELRQKSDQEEVCLTVKEELESYRNKSKSVVEENNTLTVKIQSLEKERLDYVQSVSKFKDQINLQKEEIVDMQAKLTEMDSLIIQLTREKEKVANSQKEVERLRQTNADLQSDMDACHVKEGELLEFTQRITSKNVQLQNDLSCFEIKQSSVEDDLNNVTQLKNELENQLSALNEEINTEKTLRSQETQMLARKLAEKTKAFDQTTTQLNDSHNENRVLKRRHLASVRELTRELQHCKRLMELCESNAANNGSDRTGLTSRTNSNGSLDMNAGQPNGFANHQTPAVMFIGSRDNNKTNNKAKSKILKKIKESEPQSNNTCAESVLLPDRQILIEKIVKLQRIHARKREKIEFLEEHISQLLGVIKKKSKIIQSYVMREEAGALISNSMDDNKVELSRKGGIMASVYNSHSLDGAMTLELSLEINAKVQAVLEDTLLKNITLKENISTLGEEISRLTR